MGQDPGGPLTDLKKPQPTPTQGAGEVVLKFPIKAQLSNTPPEVTAALEYEVKVSGEGIVSYLHDVVEGRKCDTASFPSQPVAIGIPVKGAISKDGEHSLCEGQVAKRSGRCSCGLYLDPRPKCSRGRV